MPDPVCWCGKEAVAYCCPDIEKDDDMKYLCAEHKVWAENKGLLTWGLDE